MARRLPDEVAAAGRSARKDGLNGDVIEQLATLIIGRARYCEQALSAGAADTAT
jgi:hypothetical protein